MTEDSIQLITNNYGKLTKNERIVADYILSHFDHAIQMSVHELAKRANVSSATPVRLAQHMGFDGYKEFRLYLAAHRPAHEDLITDLKNSSDSISKRVENALMSEIDSIKLTLRELDHEVLLNIAEKIKTADNILFFASGTSYLVCLDSMHKFERAGKSVRCTDDTTKAAIILSSFSDKDIVICVSHSGETKSVCSVLALARELGIFTIGATTFPGSRVCEIADILLFTKTRESPLHKVALTSRISQLATMDALFMTYLISDYDRCIKNIDNASKTLEKLWNTEI